MSINTDRYIHPHKHRSSLSLPSCDGSRWKRINVSGFASVASAPLPFASYIGWRICNADADKAAKGNDVHHKKSDKKGKRSGHAFTPEGRQNGEKIVPAIMCPSVKRCMERGIPATSCTERESAPRSVFAEALLQRIEREQPCRRVNVHSVFGVLLT